MTILAGPVQSGMLELPDRRLEYARHPATRPDLPPLLLLHEGLGSISLWRDFPAKLAAETGRETVVWSRRGYGRSSSLPKPFGPGYMHEAAAEEVPAVIEALGLPEPVLVGHSDGASIALIHASKPVLPVSGLVLLAPHVFVEDVSVRGIEQAKDLFRSTDLKERLSRHHDDAEAVFRAWNDVWLSPGFRDWSIEGDLSSVTAPLLLIQGVDDQYGTLEQLARIERGVSSSVDRLVLNDCGHSPHRDQQPAVIDAISSFLKAI